MSYDRKSMGKSLIYGPVPSRRLGLSLGVDMVPYKKCPFDCIYCQIGRTPMTTVERTAWVPADLIIGALEQKLDSSLTADYITLGGSGEPTLNSEIKAVIRGIKKITDIPIAVLTNGALLGDENVQDALMDADVVLPSLDAPDEISFQAINRPHQSITFSALLKGMADFRKKFSGQIWLEIFFVEGLNTGPEHIEGFKRHIEFLNPDRIHLNTAVRPTAEPAVNQVSEKRLKEIANQLGDRAEVVAEFSQRPHPRKDRTGSGGVTEDAILQMVSRRPCTVEDISSGLSLSESEIHGVLRMLVCRELIRSRTSANKIYYYSALEPGDDDKPF